jgi:serine/threonine protein kinase
MTLQIPGYRILRTLGKGGMATVYLAIQDIFERQVALKVMARGLADDPAFGQRFFREARIVSQLVHPNIVTVYDVGVHDGSYYLSMEYIDGLDLKQARKQLTISEKIQAVQDIAKALDFAGQKGFVHRDIKPENIMVSSADKRAVLMDFGIARAAETDISVTQTGLAIGTPHYMSPEQAKGKAVDIRSDLYSLGVVFYLLLTGRVPFDGDSAVAIGIKHITEPVPQLPDALRVAQPIIDALMAKLPAERYQQPSELVQALDVLSQRALQDQADDPAISSTQDNWAAATLVSAADGSMPASLVVSDDGERSFTLGFKALDDKKNSFLSWPLVIGVLAVAAASAGYFVYQQKLDREARPFARLHETATPAANRATNLAQLKENIQLVTRAYQKSDTQLPVLVKLYRDWVLLEPQSTEAAQALTQLADQQLKKMTWALNLSDYALAQRLHLSLQSLFPDYLNDRLQQQEQRLALKDRIESLLLSAKHYQETGALHQPPGANAKETFEAILALDPDITAAKEGLVALGHSADSVSLKQAKDHLLQLAGANKDASPTPTTLTDKLNYASLLVQQGSLFSPQGRSAWAIYDAILSKDPGNPQARQAMAQLVPALEDKMRQWVVQGNYYKAHEQWLAASRLKPGDKAMDALRQNLDAMVIQHERSILPQVENFVVGTAEALDTGAPQAATIKRAEALFVRVRLNAAFAQPIKLVLYEGARSRRFAEANLLLDGLTATAKITAPKSGFEPGSYTLDMVTSGHIVQSLRFHLQP